MTFNQVVAGSIPARLTCLKTLKTVNQFFNESGCHITRSTDTLILIPKGFKINQVC